MSFTVDLIVEPLPPKDRDAWKVIEILRERYYDDKNEKSPLLVALHKKLTERYPCLCSYSEEDPELDKSPWADGPMINNFASEMGMLAIVYSRVEEVLPFIIEASHSLGISVADGQSGKIHRPPHSGSAATTSKPWWKLW